MVSRCQKQVELNSSITELEKEYRQFLTQSQIYAFQKDVVQQEAGKPFIGDLTKSENSKDLKINACIA